MMMSNSGGGPDSRLVREIAMLSPNGGGNFTGFPASRSSRCSAFNCEGCVMPATLPPASMSTVSGMPSKPYCLDIVLERSNPTQPRIGFFFRNASTTPASSSVTERNSMGRPANFSINSFKCGIASTHGPHHVAQNSSTTTLPLSPSRAAATG
jgi:hypothetical protein